jgi:hypothetical protein
LRALAHDALRLGSVVPEVWIFGAGVQFAEAAQRFVEVKDASSADQATWSRLLGRFEFRRA